MDTTPYNIETLYLHVYCQHCELDQPIYLWVSIVQHAWLQVSGLVSQCLYMAAIDLCMVSIGSLCGITVLVHARLVHQSFHKVLTDLNLHLQMSFKGGEQHKEDIQRKLEHLGDTRYSIFTQSNTQILLNG